MELNRNALAKKSSHSLRPTGNWKGMEQIFTWRYLSYSYAVKWEPTLHRSLLPPSAVSSNKNQLQAINQTILHAKGREVNFVIGYHSWLRSA